MKQFQAKKNYTYEELKMIIQSIPGNVFFKDTECRYQLASHICHMLNGAREGFTIIGKTDLEVQLEYELGKQYYEEDCELIQNGGEKKYVSEMHFGGQIYYYEIVKRAVCDSDGNIFGVIGMVTDVTKMIEMQNRLEELSVTDALTGAYNRTYLQQWIGKGIGESQLPVSLIIGDCNNLKYMNDIHGHKMGDEYIVKTVELIKGNIGTPAKIIRYGGDEFLIILEKCTEEQCKQKIEILMEKSKECKINDIAISIAFGSSTIVDKQVSIYHEIEKADKKMYEEKKKIK